MNTNDFQFQGKCYILSVDVNFHIVLAWASPMYTVLFSAATMSCGISKFCQEKTVDIFKLEICSVRNLSDHLDRLI